MGAVALAGLAIGAQPVSDNSTFVHLRTGMDMVARGAIPRSDPYSFTAAGEPWVVQSWLPSFAYGLAARAGSGGFVLLQGAMTAAVALSVVALARPAGSPLRRAGAALLAIGVAGLTWSPRPLLVGLLGLALLQLAVARRWPWWAFLAVGWVWVNSHGSFPLALVWLALTAAGAALDERRLVTERLRRGAWIVPGILLGALNPLGPRLLLFPLALADHREVFGEIVEWRSPDFQSPSGLVSAACLAVVVVVLSRRRVPWQLALPAAGFTFLGLYSMRNLAPLGIVLAPALAAALGPGPAEARTAEGAPAPRRWGTTDRLAGAALAAGALVVLANAASSPALDLRSYPVDVVARGERTGLLEPGRRVAHSDVVGGYLILRRGRAAGVFVDDRYDMYPPAVAEDYVRLVRADPDAPAILRRRDVEAVLWKRDHPLVRLLRRSGWREADGDAGWAVLVPCRAPAAPGGGAGQPPAAPTCEPAEE